MPLRSDNHPWDGGPVAVVFRRFGPYHLARLSAAGGLGPVVGVELYARGGEYAWDESGGADGFRRVTLAANADRPDPELPAKLERVLDDALPSVVFAPGWGNPAAATVLRWCRRTGVPAVVMSESSAGDAPRSRWRELVKRRVVGCFSAALVGGTRHAEYVVGLGMPADRVFEGYDAVDNAHFSAGVDAARADPAARRRLGLPVRYFLASARFLPAKNLPGLLAGFARYRATAGADAWDLVLLGDGPQRPAVEQVRAALGLTESVHLPGFRQYDELPTYYGLAGAFVHASTAEPWGLVVNEAMAAGLPVVVSDRSGCAPDLVEPGVTGYRFDPADPAELGGLLARVAADPDGRAAMGAAGRERVERYGPAAFAAGLWAAARTAVTVPRPRPGIGGWLAVAALGRRGQP